jgi:Ca2+-binding EF-hand superfamily protein
MAASRKRDLWSDAVVSELNNRDAFRRPAKSHLEMSEDFQCCDTNQDGRIDFDEFKEFLECLGARITPTELLIGFREIDTNRDGLIDLPEFLTWWRDQ